jgi:hypothetical protein
MLGIKKEYVYRALWKNKIFKSLILSLKDQDKKIPIGSMGFPQSDTSDQSIENDSFDDDYVKKRTPLWQMLTMFESFTKFPRFLDSEDFGNIIWLVLTSEYSGYQPYELLSFLKLVKRADQSRAIDKYIAFSLRLIAAEDMRGHCMLFRHFESNGFRTSSYECNRGGSVNASGRTDT